MIGLLNGVRKNVFPLEQFVDGKPVAGIADVLLNAATPLARLKRGRLDEVLRAAQTNVGQ